MYYIMDAGIDSELICSRLWKASQFYTPYSQTVWKKNEKKKWKEKEGGLQVFCSMPRYFGIVTLFCYTSNYNTFKQSIHDCSYMSVELFSLTGQGNL